MDKLKVIVLAVLALAIVVRPMVTNSSEAQERITGGPSDQLPLTAAEIAAINKEDHFRRLAALALLEGHYATAEAYARTAMGSPDDWSSGAEPYLALALDAEGKDQEALQVFSQIYVGDQWDPGILLPYAELLLKHSQWAKALDVYNHALPDVGGGPIHGHQLLLEDSNFTEDDPEPTDLEAHIHIALAMAGDYVNGADGHNHPGRSVAEAMKALALEPDSPLANLEYAEALKEAGHGAEANAVFRDVASKNGGDIKAAADWGVLTTRFSSASTH